MICRNCGKTNVIKNGKAKESQKYKCKNCNFQFIHELKIDPDIKQESVLLYKLGVSIPKISKIFNISTVNVFNWLKEPNRFCKKGKLIVLTPSQKDEEGPSVFLEILENE